MTLVLGVDPGNSGAFAVVDSVTKRLVDVQDMPTWFQVVGNKKRPRIDALAIADLFDTYEMMGVELMVLEAVGGRPSQSASAAFVFGYGLGLIYMAGRYAKIPVETPPPATWKRLLNVPGKKKADDSAIMQRSYELFPHDRQMFMPESKRTTKPRVDRAEAAMLAYYGAEYIINRSDLKPRDTENALAYRNVETGA